MFFFFDLQGWLTNVLIDSGLRATISPVAHLCTNYKEALRETDSASRLLHLVCIRKRQKGASSVGWRVLCRELWQHEHRRILSPVPICSAHRARWPVWEACPERDFCILCVSATVCLHTRYLFEGNSVEVYDELRINSVYFLS